MSEKNGGEMSQYSSFLRSLNDSQLLGHIQSLSQHSREERAGFDDDVQGESTRLGLEGIGGVAGVGASFTSTQSGSIDPFDDGLDNVLAAIAADGKKSLGVENGENLESRAADGPVGPAEQSAEHSAGEEEAPEAPNSDEEEDALDSYAKALPRHDFGDYGTYFQNKHLKQQKADEEYVRWDRERRKQTGDDSERLPIFQGCIIHVNGHTTPSIEEIHRIVILHGGRFAAHLENKGSVTHIVCNRLTPRKKVEFKNCRVVRADWVTDCLNHNKLLDWKHYRLIEELPPDQKRLDKWPQKVNPVEDTEKAEDATDPEMHFDLIDKIDNDNNPKVTEEDSRLFEDLSNQGKDRHLDAKHPDFLKHFFEKSRLHHLSTWKAEMRLKFLRRIMENADSKAKKSIQGIDTDGKDRVIMHIDFDCFFASASCLKHPELDITKDPIAVTHGGRTSDIASCNYIARSFGVKNGMWGAKARKLCPNLIELGYEFGTYEDCSNKLYEYLLELEIFDHIFPVLIDEVLVDVTSHILKDGDCTEENVSKLSKLLRDEVHRRTGCSISIGISHNVLLAKLALRRAKPNGAFYLHSDITNFLDSVPIRDLPGVGRSIENKVADELKLDKDETPLITHMKTLLEGKLATVFGKKTGSKLYLYCKGIDSTCIELNPQNSEAILSRKSVSVDINYGIRFDKVSQVDTFLMSIAQELHERLLKLGLCGSQTTLKLARRAKGAPIDPPKYLGMGVCDSISKSSSLGVATNDWGVIGSELKALYRMINIPVEELRGVAVTLSRLDDTKSNERRRQMRLPFQGTNGNSDLLQDKPAMPFEEIEYKLPKSQHALDVSNASQIDWDVFEELPDTLKLELIVELKRRGIYDYKRLAVALKEISRTNSPNSKPKAFLQQLLPSQSNTSPKYVRVFEETRKSPTKKSPTRRMREGLNTPSPVKRAKMETKTEAKLEVPYDMSGSYDSSVLGQLPSSIQKEIERDIAYKKKIKSFDTKTMQEKFKSKATTKLMRAEDKITAEWISRHKVARVPFLNQQLTSSQIFKEIEAWVDMSLEQAGPHLDDVDVFVSFLKQLLQQGYVYQLILYVKCLLSNIQYQEGIANAAVASSASVSSSVSSSRIALDEWNDAIIKMIMPILSSYHQEHHIELTLE